MILMKKSLLFIIFISYPLFYCIAQNNPNAINDSINAAAKRLNESIDAHAKMMNDSINANIQRINSNILESVQPVSTPKPSTFYDTIVFDSLHGKLSIIIKNINKIAGNLHVALFNSYLNFMNNGPPYRGAIVPVTGNTVSVLMDSISRGTYSVAVFQDEDKNGKLDKNKLNIPIEGYGFSNNVPVSFGPPTYTDTKFYYSGKNKTISINMIYFNFPK
jgi:uncharacterized protein (DUF2141 family)